MQLNNESDGLILFQKHMVDFGSSSVVIIINSQNQRFVLGQKIENTLIAILEIVITIS